MIFKKKRNVQMKLGLMIGMKVCVPKFNAEKNLDEAKLGYVIARKQCFMQSPISYTAGGMYLKYLVKFSDGSVEEYNEKEVYVDYDRRLEDE